MVKTKKIMINFRFQLICSNKLIMLNKLKQINQNIKLFNKCLILNKK